MTAIKEWVPFDPEDKSSHPVGYGRYLVCRKDGKLHWEVWNGTGWAYNSKSIVFWANISNPLKNMPHSTPTGFTEIKK